MQAAGPQAPTRAESRARNRRWKQVPASRAANEAVQNEALNIGATQDSTVVGLERLATRLDSAF